MPQVYGHLLCLANIFLFSKAKPTGSVLGLPPAQNHDCLLKILFPLGYWLLGSESLRLQTGMVNKKCALGICRSFMFTQLLSISKGLAHRSQFSHPTFPKSRISEDPGIFSLLWAKPLGIETCVLNMICS